MDDIKLTIDQKNIINDIVKNKLNPQKKIEEVLANKKRLLGEILAGIDEINILLDKKNKLDGYFEKYSSLKKAKKDEYNKLLSKIKDIAGKMEIAEKQFYIKKDNNSEGKVDQIKKNITDIKLLRDNRKLYSEKFLAIKLKTIENIKKLLLERVITQKAYEELENEVINMKTFGIEFTELEKGQILETIKEKYKDDKNIIDIVRHKEEWKKLKKAQEDIQKKIKIKTEKTIQIPIDYTNNSTEITEKPKEILPNGHINEVFGDDFYQEITDLGNGATSTIDDIYRIHSISKNGFSSNNLKEDTDFVIDFLSNKGINGDLLDIFANDSKWPELMRRESNDGNDKKVREIARMGLEPHGRIQNIIVLLESLNIKKYFNEIIDRNSANIIKTEVEKYNNIIKNIVSAATNTSNIQFIEIVNEQIENISDIYNKLCEILIKPRAGLTNNFHEIINMIGEYMGIWHAISAYRKNNKINIDKKEYELEQLIFNQLIQFESKEPLINNYQGIYDARAYIDYIKGITGDKEDESDKISADSDFLSDMYASVDAILGIFVNQIKVYEKKLSILSEDKLNLQNSNYEFIDKYKELGDRYYELMIKQNISEDVISIGATTNVSKEQEQIMPIWINKEGKNRLMIGVGVKRQIDIFHNKEKLRSKDNKSEDEENVGSIKDNFYREADILDHKLIVPMIQFGIVPVILHEDGEISADGMSPYSLIDILGELNYERIRAWLFYYIYSANLENNKLGNPTEELGLNKKIEKTVSIPKENKTKIITIPTKKIEEVKVIPDEVLELSGYISDYLKDQKLSNGIQRIAYKSFQQRLFDFERYEKTYKIDKNDENRIEIKKRANDNGREGSHIEPKTEENEIEEEERIDEEVTDTDESDNAADIQAMPENIEGRIKFLEANNMYIYKSNKEKIEEFLINGSIEGKKYIGITPKSLYKSIISENKIIKKNRHNKNRRNIRIQQPGRRIMTMVDKKFLVVDIASYNDTYKKVRYNKYKQNPNYSKEDMYIPE